MTTTGKTQAGAVKLRDKLQWNGNSSNNSNKAQAGVVKLRDKVQWNGNSSTTATATKKTNPTMTTTGKTQAGVVKLRDRVVKLRDRVQWNKNSSSNNNAGEDNDDNDKQASPPSWGCLSLIHISEPTRPP